MSSNFFQRLSFLVVLLALTALALQRDWQGTGSMNETVMTEIHTQINNNPIYPSSQTTQIESIAKNISTRLNGLWDPAWNVVIVKAIQPTTLSFKLMPSETSGCGSTESPFRPRVTS